MSSRTLASKGAPKQTTISAAHLDFELLGAFFLRSLSLEAGELERPRVRLAGRGESLRLLDTDLSKWRVSAREETSHEEK
eukprot:1157685-Pelagomonas_calceolata.AAC.10